MGEFEGLYIGYIGVIDFIVEFEMFWLELELDWD